MARMVPVEYDSSLDFFLVRAKKAWLVQTQQIEKEKREPVTHHYVRLGRRQQRMNAIVRDLKEGKTKYQIMVDRKISAATFSSDCTMIADDIFFTVISENRKFTDEERETLRELIGKKIERYDRFLKRQAE